jgi:hypothetical protein
MGHCEVGDWLCHTAPHAMQRNMARFGNQAYPNGGLDLVSLGGIGRG